MTDPGRLARPGCRALPARRWAGRVFSIDPRSLRLFRMALGSLVFMDLCARASALADHYSDGGVLPRRSLIGDPSAAYHFCVHAWAGSTAFETLLFAIAAALAVAFVLGRGGVAVAFALWALTVSLQNRNFMVLNKGDQIFRLLLFWSMLLPLRSRRPVLSVASAGLLIQAALVWLVSASLKTGRDWFPDGTATYYALQIDQGTTAFGHWIGAFFPLTRALTYGVFFVEWAAAFLLFCPVWTNALRAVAVVALAAMHIGFGLAMRLGFFPAISICSLVPFIPGVFWERLGVRAAQAPRKSDGLWRRTLAGLGALRSAASAPARRPVRLERGRALPSSAVLPERPPRAAGTLGRFADAAAVAALLLVLWINLAAARVLRTTVAPPAARLAAMLRLDQNWSMFAPRPWRETSWYVIAGRLADGRRVDAYRLSSEPPETAEPRRLSSTFESTRWLYYMTNLAMDDNARERPWFARYLCRRFDAAHVTSAPIETIDIELFREWALPGYRRTPPRQELLWRQDCDRIRAGEGG